MSKSLDFYNSLRKFKKGGMVPGRIPYPKLLAWYYGPEVDEILKGEAVRLKDIKKSGDKYLRNIVLKHEVRVHKGTTYSKVDVYAVLEAFDVRCPAVAHAVKKLLCPGARGTKDIRQDLQEAKDALERADQMEYARIGFVDALAVDVENTDPNEL